MKILVVDDDKTSRRIYQREFRNADYEVVEASDGFEAIHVVHDQEVDLVVLDIEMPDMDGYQVCTWLRSEQFSQRFNKNETILPIIFVTSDESLESRLKGFRAGATDFVNKGFKQGTLLKVVDRILKPLNVLAGLTALVVDDSKLVREMVRGMLLEQRVKVIEATNGREGYDKLVANLKSVDMVITDLEMPLMKGDELCYKIRRDLGLKELPVIFLTAIPDRSILIDLFKAGANDYLVKPFVKEELIARLRVTREMLKELGDEVAERKRIHKEMVISQEIAEKNLSAAGKVEFTTTVLHNVSNVLNSVAVSGAQAERMVARSRLSQLLMALRLMDKHSDDLATFFKEDPKGSQLPQYFKIVSGMLETEHHQLVEELGELNKKLTLMKDIIEVQQRIAMQRGDQVIRPVTDLLTEALNVNHAMLEKCGVSLKKQMTPGLEILVLDVEFIHVLINLVKNAIEAMNTSQTKVLTLESGKTAEDLIFIRIGDTGSGIAPENMKNMFQQGFTTKETGHGFGLPYCARTITNMGGKVSVSSPGLNLGAVFEIILPLPPLT